jgi:glutathione peroxidase
VLGFPCNQFGAQEPGNADEIKNFCSLNYDVTFPLFAKIDVKGANAAPLYDYLTREKGGGLLGRDVKWNFTKFLISRDGNVIARYAPTVKPEALEGKIEKAL